MRALQIIILLSVIISACNSGPKVIVEDTETGITDGAGTALTTSAGAPMNSTPGGDMHQVVALDVLQTERYTYMQVLENLDTSWIATSHFDGVKGKTYFYRGGLLKTDFESLDLKRSFPKIFLVSDIIDAASHPGGSGATGDAAVSQVSVSSNELKEVPGSIKLSELFKNKEKYKNKVVIVSGKSVKVNYAIMDRNWIHIQDGSKIAGKNCDLTVTTTDNIPLDANVAFEGKIILNKDFGAGYKYDIILEEAKMR